MDLPQYFKLLVFLNPEERKAVKSKLTNIVLKNIGICILVLVGLVVGGIFLTRAVVFRVKNRIAIIAVLLVLLAMVLLLTYYIVIYFLNRIDKKAKVTLSKHIEKNKSELLSPSNPIVADIKKIDITPSAIIFVSRDGEEEKVEVLGIGLVAYTAFLDALDTYYQYRKSEDNEKNKRVSMKFTALRYIKETEGNNEDVYSKEVAERFVKHYAKEKEN